MNFLADFDNSKKENHVDPKFIALAGDKGQGKSTLLRAIAETRYSQIRQLVRNETGEGGLANRRVLVHNANDSRAFEGIPEITVNQLRYGIIDPITKAARPWKDGIRQIKTNSLEPDSNKEIITVIYEKMRNSVIILDEANMWVPSRNTPKPWELALFTQHRNHNNIIYAMFHNLMDIHRILRQHIFQYVLFKIPDNLQSVQNIQRLNFPNPKALYDGWVNIENAPYHRDRRMQDFVVIDKDFSSRVSMLPKGRTKVKRRKNGK